MTAVGGATPTNPLSSINFYVTFTAPQRPPASRPRPGKLVLMHKSTSAACLVHLRADSEPADLCDLCDLCEPGVAQVGHFSIAQVIIIF